MLSNKDVSNNQPLMGCFFFLIQREIWTLSIMEICNFIKEKKTDKQKNKHKQKQYKNKNNNK